MRWAILLVFASGLWAHEIGTSRVSVIFHEGKTFDAELVTDGGALAEKLESVNGGTFKDSTPAPQLLEILKKYENSFRQRVKLSFDGQDVRPEIRFAVEPPIDATSAAAATIHLTGKIPEGVRQFQWTFGWTFASYALSLRNSNDGIATTEWLDGGQPSKAFSLTAPVRQMSRWQTALRYLTLGFTHILPNGLDHMLFVLGIYLLSQRARTVLWQVSAFTVAHSITLGLSLYGLIHVSPRIVEPAIAISIAYVAIENVFLKELRSWRVALVFAFGLLHGMGFAAALQELDLPRSEFLTALLSFNVGVEAGQLAVIGVAFLFIGWQFSQRIWYRSRVVIPASAAIACMALYWTVERIVA